MCGQYFENWVPFGSGNLKDDGTPTDLLISLHPSHEALKRADQWRPVQRLSHIGAPDGMLADPKSSRGHREPGTTGAPTGESRCAFFVGAPYVPIRDLCRTNYQKQMIRTNVLGEDKAVR